MKKLLATDLDGTFIPWSNELPIVTALEKFRQLRKNNPQFGLIFVTGRDLQLVLHAIAQHNLPVPDAIIADVGTSIYHHTCALNSAEFPHQTAYGQCCLNADYWEPNQEYQKELYRIVKANPRQEFIQKVSQIQGIRQQESVRQSEFKISFYCDTHYMESAQNQVECLLKNQTEWSGIYSIDPESAQGLIDVLPHKISKRYALEWFLQHHARDVQKIAFAGDSGNDYAMFLSGLPAILVANTPQHIKDHTQAHAKQAQFIDSIFIATQPSTAGVWEGCQHFGIV
jgi:HAD superfamily hydrolase (TIGR01484 family)